MTGSDNDTYLCLAPACPNPPKHRMTFESFEVFMPNGEAIKMAGKLYYTFYERRYCSKHMLEQLEFLIEMMKVEEKDSEKKDNS